MYGISQGFFIGTGMRTLLPRNLFRWDSDGMDVCRNSGLRSMSTYFVKAVDTCRLPDYNSVFCLRLEADSLDGFICRGKTAA